MGHIPKTAEQKSCLIVSLLKTNKIPPFTARIFAALRIIWVAGWSHMSPHLCEVLTWLSENELSYSESFHVCCREYTCSMWLSAADLGKYNHPSRELCFTGVSAPRILNTLVTALIGILPEYLMSTRSHFCMGKLQVFPRLSVERKPSPSTHNNNATVVNLILKLWEHMLTHLGDNIKPSLVYLTSSVLLSNWIIP